MKIIRIIVISILSLTSLGFATISMFHVQDFLSLSNPTSISWAGAILYEMTNIAVLMAIILRRRFQMFWIWGAFGFIIIMQMVGNLYFCYNFVKNHISIDSHWLSNFSELLMHVFPLMEDQPTHIFWLSIMGGVIFPVVSILLSKGLSDFVNSFNEEEEEELELPSYLNYQTQITDNTDEEEEDIDTEEVDEEEEEVINEIIHKSDDELEESEEEEQKEEIDPNPEPINNKKNFGIKVKLDDNS